MASFPVDLDAQLRFVRGEIVLSNRRLLSVFPGDPTWQSWDLHVGEASRLALKHYDHAGVGTLELHDASQCLARWRFTLNAHSRAMYLVEQFEKLLSAQIQTRADDEPGVCTTCHAQIPPDAEECPVCNRESQIPPSTWVLLRLWRFARPYQWQLRAGFLLTLGATAATLVPP
ncbi:MAG TPA: ABC transporter, partial [Aquabacterium sp.]|nr:ABC transporter [Aquabacterium sp.]